MLEFMHMMTLGTSQNVLTSAKHTTVTHNEWK